MGLRVRVMVWEADLRCWAPQKELGTVQINHALQRPRVPKFLPCRTSGITLSAGLKHPASKQSRTMGTKTQVPEDTPSGKPARLRALVYSAGRFDKCHPSPSAGFPGDLQQLISPRRASVCSSGDRWLPSPFLSQRLQGQMMLGMETI